MGSLKGMRVLLVVCLLSIILLSQNLCRTIAKTYLIKTDEQEDNPDYHCTKCQPNVLPGARKALNAAESASRIAKRVANHATRQANQGRRKANKGIRKANQGMRKANQGMRKANQGIRRANQVLGQARTAPCLLRC